MSNKMFRLVLISALVALASAAPKVRSNLPQLDGRIIGGSEIDIKEALYQLSLQYYGSHICGASILSPRFAVTAAHCTDGSTASSLAVRAGSSTHASGGEVVQVSKIYQHPQYDSFNIDYDVSVLELVSDLTQGAPIEITKKEAAAGAMARCTGWGTTAEGGSLPNKLMAVDVPMVSRQVCESAYGSDSISKRMVCAGLTEGGKDACQGDSGGPLVSDGKLVGIVSWGYGCARPNYPGVYSNVAELASFIEQNSN